MTVRDTMHYRFYFFFLILGFACHAAAQTRDTRALLDIKGKIIGLDVAPNGRVWLATDAGNLYFSDDISKEWYYGFAPVTDTGIIRERGSFIDVSFFNKDIGIITGFIRSSKKSQVNDGYLLTRDGGKNWELHSYGAGNGVYSAYTTPTGKAWLGGSRNEMYISGNYAQQWRTVKLPFKKQGEIFSIHMHKGVEGIAGQQNEILVTADNWVTSRPIPTPMDQGKYKPRNEAQGHTVFSAFIWKDYYVVNQDMNVFYTHKKNIDWKPFPVNLYNIALDEHSEMLYGLSITNEVLTFKTPQSFIPVGGNSVAGMAMHMTAVSNSVYIFSNDGTSNICYKVNDDKFIEAIPYTTDRKIPKPEMVRKAKQVTWGVTGNHIYASDNGGKEWYRAYIASIKPADIEALTDNTLLLWDGQKKNYLYTSGQDRLESYRDVKPLSNFIKYPLQSFSITSSSAGCFNINSESITYVRKNDSIFSAEFIEKSERQDEWLKEQKTKIIFKHNISSKTPATILAMVNDHYDSIPYMKDFRITATDKKNYMTLVRKSRYDSPDTMNYFRLVRHIDSVGMDTIQHMLEFVSDYGSTTTNSVMIRFINLNNDTLTMKHENESGALKGWMLPWQVDYKRKHFVCSNLAFSRFVKDCMPPGFMHKIALSNRYLILDIADYIYSYR